MNRREFLKKTLITTSLSLAVFPTNIFAKQQIKKLNLLIIMTDDLGWGDLSCQYAKDIKTPNIDSLFAKGMKFENFRTNCCVCSPTRASFFTARNPEKVGIPGVVRTHRDNNWGCLTKDAVFIPEILQAKGYFTSLIGKWHLGLNKPNTPNNRGFDEFHGFLGDMMDDYYTHLRHGNNYMRYNEKTIETKGTHATELFTQWSIDSLRNCAKENKPFAQFLMYNAPHDPIQPPQEWLKKVTTREKNMHPKRAGLVALIEHTDHCIGRVLDSLKGLNLADNTIIVFTSDNGGATKQHANNGPYRSGKTHIYEGGIKVPACVVWPSKIKQNSKTDFNAQTMDIMPTLLDATEIKINHEIEGLSFLPTLLQKKQKPFNRYEYYTWLQGKGHNYKKRKYAVRKDKWKLTNDQGDEECQLFDLSKDPYEKNDISKKHPEIFQELQKVIKMHMEEVENIPWQRTE